MILYVCRYSKTMSSARYRGYGWADRLRTRGHSVKVIYVQRGYQRDHFFNKLKKALFLLRLMALLARAKVVVFQKYAPPVFLLKFLRKKRVVFDFDDRIYDMQLLLDRMSRIRSILHASDRIVVSVDALKEELTDHFPYLASRVAVIPTLIDLARFSERPPEGRPAAPKSNLVIGWVGSSGGFSYLELIEEVLFKLLHEFREKLTFRVVSDRPFLPRRFDFPVQNVRWALERECEYFSEIDLSIMPLDDSERARSKAGFKAIQSLAAGLPVVASAIGFNKEIIRHGENGFLAENPAEFYTYLKRLATDDPLRRKMGRTARQSAWKFDYSAWEKLYLEQIFSEEAPDR
ncbi:MAG TPA: glycosyltransferase family 4 protein [Candidatus Manganitrophaceae bacterium]|nr:glycosyltransferase family 4 protein [Candidatus Manganitrophaceae bacterium]